jgi:deoxycytidylate deaminase
MVPCYACAKVVVNAGIKRCVVSFDYQLSERTKDVFKQAGVKLEIINKKVMKYPS